MDTTAQTVFDISTTAIPHESKSDIDFISQNRQPKLRQLLLSKKIVRVLEVHSALSAIIAENAATDVDGEIREFDAMWESSLTDSLSKGKPDISVVDMTSRIQTIDQIFDVTTKPMIVDVDNGGLIDYFCFSVRTLDRIGVSAIIVEDKIGNKRNSLSSAGAVQLQDEIDTFSEKISAGISSRRSSDLLIISRIESLVLGKGVEDALVRAASYIDAGTDGIMIHSASRSPTEIIDFCERYNKRGLKKPLVVVPTTYSSITETELSSLGVRVVIYANHLLRSAIPPMIRTAQTILRHSRGLEAEEVCLPISETIAMARKQW